MVEAYALAQKGVSIYDRMFVDGLALITTPFHILLNRAREQARGITHHGTTGMGISETVMDHLASGEESLMAGDLGMCRSSGDVQALLQDVKDRLLPELMRVGGNNEFERVSIPHLAETYFSFTKMARILNEEEVTLMMQVSKGIVFEGAQGVLLDQDCGFHPHTTWSTTTDKNAFTIMGENHLLREHVAVLGITRTYHTRHGAGPMPTEVSRETFYPEEPHNGDDVSAGQFRNGWLDFTLLKYARRHMGYLSGLVVSHCDVKPEKYLLINPELDDESSYPTLKEQEALTRRAYKRAPLHMCETMPEDAAEFIAEELGVPLFMKASGPTWKDREIVMKGEPKC
jgi:adenylosuccinate synthase